MTDPTSPKARGAATPASARKGRLGKLVGFLRRSRSEEEVDALSLLPATRRMRSFSGVLFFLLGVAVTALVVGNPLGLSFLPRHGGEAPVAGAPTAGESSAIYQCPMHPEVVQGEPGDCTICGMDLVAVEQRDAGSRDHAAGEEKPVYQCPMHPEVVQGEPGDCTICGMDLVAVARPGQANAAHREGASGLIEIDPVLVQNIGVVSTGARREDIARTSRTVGILDFNADGITWINTKFEGWIEKVHVNYPGQAVRDGEPLFEIYSPELVTTQEEYLKALDYWDSLRDSDRRETRKQAEDLLRATRERLVYWDISEDQIRTLEENRQSQRRLTVRSPVNGVVVELMNQALEGMFVRPGMDLYQIADLATVWVHADVFESDLSWIREGQPAVVSFRHDPGKVIRGSVLFLYPEVSRETRTLKVCVVLPNRDRRLRPGMYADVVIQGPPVRDVVVIPESAVLRSGERDLVFVDLGEGRFEPRQVTLGLEGEGDRIQIIDGLKPGEVVVTQAQFMLDSESRIQEAIAKFMARGTHRSDGARSPSSSNAGHIH